MAPQPTCPECNGDVRPSWDWCQNCGYDPAGLKPTGWTPEATSASPPSSPRASAPNAWVAPAPTPRPARPGGGQAVTTLVDPEAARPQRMRDPDWVQAAPRTGLPVPALVGLVAVVAAAVVGLIIVTLLVLHRPIGTTNDGAQAPGTTTVVLS